MAQKPASPPAVQDKLQLRVRFDDEDVEVEILASRKVRDLIEHALMSFALQEDSQKCRLAVEGYIFYPDQPLLATDLESGERVALRVPI